MRIGKWVTVALAVALVFSTAAFAATEEAKQAAIDDGLAWLASTQATSGNQGYWPYANAGTLAATGSAALAFIEEGYLPGEDVIIGGTNYGDVVGRACSYIFSRATDVGIGWETAGYPRHAEDYNNDGVLNDGGNGEGIYFDASDYRRSVYTTGIVTPVIAALGDALGRATVVGAGPNGFALGGGDAGGMTYEQVMRDVVDWFAFAQVEPDRGIYRGGWRYYANEGASDNSTAQWGALPLIYADAWGLAVPDYVFNELELWTDHIQYLGSGPLYGSSGYTQPGDSYSNMSKTGGLLLELYALGVPITDTRVQAALQFIESRWNNGASGWFGNLNNPYAMWAVYKGLEVYGMLGEYPGADFLIGEGMPTAPGGFTIGYEGDTKTSAAGDWYSHYSDFLTNIQNGNGSWSGNYQWTGALASGWYINILNATGAPPPPPAIPEPGSLALVGVGLLGFAWIARRRRRS